MHAVKQTYTITAAASLAATNVVTVLLPLLICFYDCTAAAAERVLMQEFEASKVAGLDVNMVSLTSCTEVREKRALHGLHNL